jgi:transcription antitermination factor NusB
MSIIEEENNFPLSKTREKPGSRRLGREKALQILFAYEFSGSSLETLFDHIFYRKFNFGDKDKLIEHKLLTKEEIYEIESDIPILWKEDEIKFVKDLITYTIETREFAEEMIIKFAANWNIERIAHIDKLLLHLAITELLKFSEIPTKVTINEAIDIGKKYSTPKSGIFINGVLDSVHLYLKENDMIIKTGRGLIDK